ncbi:MAG: DUF1858 domain-containing protein [Paludibacter sp.]|nr:DUF1858 domain-containing protein [Paludibacter sp.]
MEINFQTKIVALLDAYPALEKTLLELSPAFARLQNPTIRRTVAKVATLQQAAQMADISPEQMIQILRKEAGLNEISYTEENNCNENRTEPQPEWFDENKITMCYDASPVIDSGDSPMQDIIQLINMLKNGEIMELTVPFKPMPIIDMIKSKGFKSWYCEGKTFFTKA